MLTGLIKAACRQFDSRLQIVNGRFSIPRNSPGNGVAKPKVCQNGNAKILLNGTYYPNGNGVHVYQARR